MKTAECASIRKCLSLRPNDFKLRRGRNERKQSVLRRALDEYQVGGIKTTLGFFREIVRDEEFIAGRLDTGFIARFNERREAARRSVPAKAQETEVRRQDLALIAGAIHYAKLQREASLSRQPTGETKNRWKISGRSALIRQRSVIDKRAKKPERPA